MTNRKRIAPETQWSRRWACRWIKTMIQIRWPHLTEASRLWILATHRSFSLPRRKHRNYSRMRKSINRKQMPRSSPRRASIVNAQASSWNQVRRAQGTKRRTRSSSIQRTATFLIHSISRASSLPLRTWVRPAWPPFLWLPSRILRRCSRPTRKRRESWPTSNSNSSRWKPNSWKYSRRIY